MNSLKMMIVLMLISLLFLTSMSYAIQDRRPVDPPVPNDPVEPEDCPTIFLNLNCNANGKSSDKVCVWALSQAGYDCSHKLKKCYKSQYGELLMNKGMCESVPKCTLKYTVEEDECELGNVVTDCDPAPGTSDPSNTTYTCRINGSYNITGYRCDRGTANEGEFTA